LPVDTGGNIARIIERWHGRIVLSGVTGDPNNWFMSAVDDPYDFNYFPDAISPTMAVAGNNSDAGLMGDVITALIPYTNDVLLMGGEHTIYRMSGDPADGGRIDLVSDITGIAFGRAWCKSPEGTIYFMGSRGGIYRIDPQGGLPQRLTAQTIDERLADVNMDTNSFRLVWDDRHICVRIFITPKSGGSTTHYTWDVRNQAWWPTVFGNTNHNPFAVLLLSGYSATDRAVLMGGQDGYIRLFDPDAATDDGTAIDSYVYLGPFTNTLFQEFQATLGNTSERVQWSIHEAQNLEDALAAPAATSGRWNSGRNRSQWPRRYVRSGYIRLGATTRWSMERVIAKIEQGSVGRGRIF
jgi:hypothetical protein